MHIISERCVNLWIYDNDCSKIIISLHQEGCVFALKCFCLFLHRITIKKNVSINYDKLFGGVGSVTINSWLDFGGDLAHCVDKRIFLKGTFCHCVIGSIQPILLINLEVVDEYLCFFWKVNNKPILVLMIRVKKILTYRVRQNKVAP